MDSQRISSPVDPHACGAVPARKRVLSWVGLLLAVWTSGCATTEFSLDEPPTVTESRAKRDLGVDYLSSRRTAMAIRELTNSLHLDPSDPQTHLWLGEAYRRKGQVAKAEDFLMDALELATERKDSVTQQQARLSLSALLSHLGRYSESIEHCEALAEDPTFSAPWKPLNNCGWALLQLGEEDAARRHFVDALDFFPRFSPALLNLGILESKQGHRLAAIRAFEGSLETGRLSSYGRAEANYRLGEIYVALGQREKAVEHFRASVEHAPHIDWGTQSQAYLDLILPR